MFEYHICRKLGRLVCHKDWFLFVPVMEKINETLICNVVS